VDTLQIESQSFNEWIDITGMVQKIVSQSRLGDGFCLLHVPHTTAAVTVNEGADPSVRKDILDFLAVYVPRRASYKHLEGNSDAHIKSTLIGVSETIPVSQGKLVLGTWQAIFFCEFDGPRSRRLHVQLSGTSSP